MFGPSELAVILIVVMAVVLAKKGPEPARSAGKSARILKAEARAVEKEENGAAADTPPRVIPGETAHPCVLATARRSRPTHRQTPSGKWAPQRDTCPSWSVVPTACP
ncbi:twin-arginine translocase TatA/TatE family subunit [Streptomyces sp. YIM B13518]|uniref:twin-arginine translocase TatA/TatE family subunit n=1 Tax=Streptomyces sp. YIM B13518 TaxID=3366316 RepID=UPI00368D20D6